MFGLPLQRVQEELSKNPPPVKVSVQVTNGKRSVNATSSSNSTSASGGPPSSAKKRKNNYGKPQNKPNNSGKSSGKPSGGFKGSKKPGPSQVSTSISRSGHYVTKSCNRGGVDLNSVSGILFPSFSGSKEDWRNEASHRPIYSEQISYCSPLQNGNKQIHQGFNPSRNVDYFSGSFRRVSTFPFPKLTGNTFAVWNNKVFQFKALPFGLSTAPLAFTKIMQAAIAHLHSLSIQIHSYLDDSLLKEFCPIKLRVQTDLVINCFLSLGFLISWKKSEIIPSQDFVFLGEHFLTSVGLVLPPEEKFTKLCQKIHLFLTVQSVTARQFLQLLGLLNSLADVIPLGRLHIRPLQFYLHKLWIAASQEWEALIPITQPLFPHLQWWLVRENVMRGLCLSPQVPSLTLFTDASTSVGEHIWRGLQSRESGSRSFGRAYQCIGNESSSVCTESFPNVSKESVCHSGHGQHNSCSLSQESGRNSFTFSLSDSQRHSPSVFSTPGSSSGETYYGAPQYSSRHSIRSLAPVNTEWELLQVVFKAVTLHWGSPQIDLFCDQSQSQTSNICVSGSRSKIFAVDARSLSWKGMFRSRLPSFQVSLPSTSENSRENCKIIVIAPAWPKQSWFPDLLRLSCACPLVLPLRPDLLSQIKGKVLYQNPLF
ncbi:unnamed protein product [Mytilus edulis]|uniref:Reverse transcriptase domain-containing protein n=1 Tax=Mytilus edulis TaxID=6550 RepID=A0A8S3TVA5_MYTED|nr:unnamed protein product [Mytilus edulis]